jgi:glycosyltransferase involved in cell wall biosynthesis
MTSPSLSPGSVPVSVLIPVKNEQRNIVDCLGSVEWANEIVVVDSASSDDTIRISIEAGARVVQFSYVPGGPRKKNWALQNLQFRNEWILILDADERITPELAIEIELAVHQAGTHLGFYLNRRFNFLGRWIYHAGYFPSWNLRLFRHGHALYEKLSSDFHNSGDNEVHEHLILEGSAGRLTALMDHFAYPTLSEFLEKHKRYAYWEAEMTDGTSSIANDGSAISRGLLMRRALKRLARRIPFPHWMRFVYHYFLKFGFCDGLEGYIFCHLLAEYEFWIWARRIELQTERKRGSFDAVR